MKILICTTAFERVVTGSAGVARAISEWTGMNSDHDIYILSEDCEVSQRSYKCGLNIGSKIPVLTYYFKSRSYWNCLKDLLREQHFDVIIYHDIWLAYGAREFLRDEKRKEAIVAFMHDDSTLEMSDLKLFSGRWLSFRMRAYLEDRVIRHLDAVLTNSNYMLSLLNMQFPGIPVYRLYYAAMNYQEMIFQPKQRDYEKAVRVLFIKNDFERGGLKELILALMRLRQFQFILNIIGPSHKRLRRKLGHLIESKGNLKIEILGPVKNQDEIKRQYLNTDLVCVPARKEALGLVNAEALASGAPVVSTGVGGIPEVLDNGRAGIITKGTSPEDIAAGILECLTDVKKTGERVIHGRKFVIERFARERMYAEFETILRKVLLRKKRIG